jgi:hypothetical protein
VEHDTYMLPVQVNTHVGNLANAVLITEMGISVKESLEYTSPFYRLGFSQMGRLVSQNPILYADIIMKNPGTLELLRKRMEIADRLYRIVRDKDYNEFIALFVEARTHFGEDVLKEANDLFMRLLSVQKTLYGKDSLILECAKSDSRPGLLGRLMCVFTERAINLTGINSVDMGERLQFAISLEQSKDSAVVRKALDEIEGWSDIRVRVLEGQ